MECFHCKGKMVKGKAPFSVDRNGYHISWDSIPAWVCTQCGEPFFEENEVTHIQKALQKVDQETVTLTSQRT
ncbi:MAG: YgiT-type zinc finger protein [Candidatus Scalindua sp.]|nr:YgiT-type zinc finger protein [Candidatus Scalindua sp.]